MKPITNALVACLLLCVLNVGAQTITTQISPATINGAVNDIVQLQVKVNNFTNVATFQCPITYNASVLEFQSVDGFGLPGLQASMVGNPQVPVPRVTMSWIADLSANPNGVTVPAGTSIMTLKFKIKASGTSTVNLASGVQPTIEAYTAGGDEFTVSFQNGGATVGTGSTPPPPPPVGFQIRATADTVAPGETFCIPITVNDFNQILTLQFAIHWDKTVLQFIETKNYNLAGLNGSASQISTVQAPSGTLLFSWYDDAAVGVTKPNGSKLMDVCFKAIGATNTSSAITFDGVGFPPSAGGAEATNASGTNVWTSTSGVSALVKVSAPLPPGPEFIVDTVQSETNKQKCVDVRVKNFTDVVIAQVGFKFDPTQLTLQLPLQDVTTLLPGFSTAINPSAATGEIKMAWSDPTVMGVDLPDNTVLFRACFMVIAPVGTVAKIEMKDLSGLPVEVYVQQGASSVEVVPTLKNGHIRVVAVQQCSVSVAVDNFANVKCNNGSDGAINITATSNQPNIAYSWSGPGGYVSTSSDVSGLKVGVYNLTVTASGTASCSTNTSVTITQPAALTPPGADVTPVKCKGGADGTITLKNLSGGTAPYTFKWSGPPPFTSTSQNLTGLKTGNYLVTVTDANQCSIVSSPILVAEPQSFVTISTASIMVTDVRCFGESNGSINLGASGGTGPYTYVWSATNLPSVTQAPPLTTLKKGLYTVSVSDNNGCTFIATGIEVKGPAELVAQLGSGQDIKCFNTSTGAITGTQVLGGNGGYVYAWKNASNQTVSTVLEPNNLPAGTYSFSVTDSKGCTFSAFGTVAIQGPSSAIDYTITNETDPKCFGQNTGSITIQPTGGWSGFTVNWLPGGMGSTLSGLPAGNYTPTVTDAKGCTLSKGPITLEAPSEISISNTIVNHIKCFGDGDGCIEIQLTGGKAPYTVAWTPGGLVGLKICTLEPGTYTPVVNDNNNCSKTFSGISVSQPNAPISVAPPLISNQFGQTPGSITLAVTGGTGQYTYVWSPGSSTTNSITGNAGDYTVTITDGNQCTFIGTYTIENDFDFQPAVGNIQAACGGAGCVTLNMGQNIPQGMKPFTISWTSTAGGSSGSTTSTEEIVEICDLTGGAQYTFTVNTATGGFTKVISGVFVQLLTPPIHSSNTIQPSEDFKNGKIDLTPTAPGNYSYEWNYPWGGPFATTQDLVNLDSGYFCVTITNVDNKCTATECWPLTQQWQPVVDLLPAEVKRPSCLSTKDGMIRVFIGGGKKPYSYDWTGPDAPTTDTSRIENLGPGFYNLTVTDARGTTKTYSWNLLPLSNLNSTFTVTPGPNGYDVSGANECDGEVRVTVTGQVPPLSFSWNNGGNSAINSTLCAGDWWAIVSDGAGCKDTLGSTLNAPTALDYAVTLSDFNGYNVKCNGTCEGQAAVSAAGGVAPYKVDWSTGFSQTLNTSSGVSLQTALCAGDYSVTITDANGITIVRPVTITQPAPMVIEFTVERPSSFVKCDGTVLAEANGAQPINYTWSSNYHKGTTEMAEELCSGEDMHWLAVDAFGCKANAEVEVPYADDGCLIFRPVLTPGQSEGKNDFLIITCIESIPDNTLEIYNRWGQLVFKTDAYDNGSNNWTGTNSQGQPLPEGVYFYVLTYENDLGQEVQLKGYINILR